MAELILKNLSSTYKGPKRSSILALKDVSCVFHDGDFNVILGSSGCGKTTLLRCILGFQPYTGTILMDDVDISSYPVRDRNFAYVSQKIVLHPHLSVFDNIAYPLKIRGMEKKDIIEKVNSIAKDLGIEECLSRKPKHISIGQAQRVAIARAIVKNPSFYFFDEPFSNLDEENRMLGLHLIQNMVQKYGTSAIYVTHSIREATSLADRIFVMDEGNIIFEGTPKELVECDIPAVKALVEADNERTL